MSYLTDCQEIVCCNEAIFGYSSEVPCDGPEITVQPQGGSISLGEGFILSVTATGASRYQWKLNGEDIPGATQNIYVILAATGLDAGTYSVVVFGEDECRILSDDVELTIGDRGILGESGEFILSEDGQHIPGEEE